MTDLELISEDMVRRLKQIDQGIVDVHSLNAPYRMEDESVASVLLDVFEHVNHRHLRMVILSVLARSKIRFDGTPLARVFDASNDERIPRWEICDTISYGKAEDVESWVAERLADPSIGTCREMLCIAAARLLPNAAACQVLKDVFPEFPAHSAIGLGLCGGADELKYLKTKVSSMTGWQKKTIQNKGIRRIERRLSA